MSIRRAAAATLIVVSLAACSDSSPPDPDVGSLEPSGGSVLEEARSVANDLEARQLVIDEHMRDPFSPLSSSG